MVTEHQFNEAELTDTFNKVELHEDIIKKISKPSEGLPWYKYRKIFLKEPRIKAGVQFWRENATTLATVEKETGVPAAIIVAIIGVETQYGQHTGHYRVIDALSTLTFAYPPRSQFFRSELENFLLLCREERIDPLNPIGSYAGAMGMPQFMPSSYRHYAVDFNKDNYRDIWHNPDDVIASIANYFAKQGWQTNNPVAFRLCDKCHKSVNSSPFLKENLSLIKSNAINPNISKPLLSTKKAKIIAFEQENGEELWATSDNFYVITRYNHSPLYAMAVYQLSLAISNLRVSSPL
jgi:membrane-bound lytic murein transglycosylase B